MKKTILLMAFAVVAAVSAQAQLLYKISGNGLTKPSYIIGTYHLAPVSFVDSIPGVKDALASADQVYGELDMSNMFEQESIAKIQAAMMLPEGQTLQTILTAEQQQKLNGVLKELMGMDLTNPMAAAQLGKISPQALVTQLSLLIFLKKSPSFDIYFHPRDRIDHRDRIRSAVFADLCHKGDVGHVR